MAISTVESEAVDFPPQATAQKRTSRLRAKARTETCDLPSRKVVPEATGRIKGRAGHSRKGGGSYGEGLKIYVPLLDEGVDIWRPGEVAQEAEDVYRILSEPIAGETWAYSSGSRVRCRRQRLDGGEELVAFADA